MKGWSSSLSRAGPLLSAQAPMFWQLVDVWSWSLKWPIWREKLYRHHFHRHGLLDKLLHKCRYLECSFNKGKVQRFDFSSEKICYYLYRYISELNSKLIDIDLILSQTFSGFPQILAELQLIALNFEENLWEFLKCFEAMIKKGKKLRIRATKPVKTHHQRRKWVWEKLSRSIKMIAVRLRKAGKCSSCHKSHWTNSRWMVELASTTASTCVLPVSGFLKGWSTAPPFVTEPL